MNSFLLRSSSGNPLDGKEKREEKAKRGKKQRKKNRPFRDFARTANVRCPCGVQQPRRISEFAELARANAR
jgi:hypothetical protein